jgi:RING finger protein 113A
MFKKSAKKRNVRKRQKADSDSSGDDTEVIRADLGSQKKVNSFGTGTSKKLKTGLSTSLNTIESDRNATAFAYGGSATATGGAQDTAADRDNQAILERNLKANEDGTADDRGTYHGQAGYKNYIKKDEAQVAGNKYSGTQGPIRAPQWARATCAFDYQPDVCKDYKDTGFCGFGDSCKFMHDRGNYKTGWQLEQEWQAEEKDRKLKLAMGEKDTEGEDKKVLEILDIQFACPLSRQPFHTPIVTACGHCFEEKAILKYYKKNSACPMCAKSTYGNFNKAIKLFAALAKREETLKKLGKVRFDTFIYLALIL